MPHEQGEVFLPPLLLGEGGRGVRILRGKRLHLHHHPEPAVVQVVHAGPAAAAGDPAVRPVAEPRPAADDVPVPGLGAGRIDGRGDGQVFGPPPRY